jgi:ferredoxin
MDESLPVTIPPVVMARGALQTLIDILIETGYEVVGPTVRDGAIVYDHISGLSELPAGWTDRQEAGEYRLERRDDDALFSYAVGPQSWKRFLHPPLETLWSAHREGDGIEFASPPEPSTPYAFIGVRACELQAITIQDRVFCQGQFQDQAYAARRRHSFIVAVNCAEPGGTCFCASMQTGPRAQQGFDLALTELPNGEALFVVEIGSEAGAAMLAKVPQRPAAPGEVEAARRVVAAATTRMGRRLQTEGIKDLLQANPNHAQWEALGKRCLSCGNCTMVCPTCFCTSVDEVGDLAGETVRRDRKWDSCFTMDFSYIHGGSVRHSSAARYRQWMTHKLANWIDQFGTSGCVGCGRCITWCPVGIDITAEVAAIRADVQGTGSAADAGP